MLNVHISAAMRSYFQGTGWNSWGEGGEALRLAIFRHMFNNAPPYLKPGGP